MHLQNNEILTKELYYYNKIKHKIPEYADMFEIKKYSFKEQKEYYF